MKTLAQCAMVLCVVVAVGCGSSANLPTAPTTPHPNPPPVPPTVVMPDDANGDQSGAPDKDAPTVQ